MTRSLRFQSLTIERTMVLILFMLLFTLAARVQVDTDMWWHLRLGQYVVETRTIPTVDLFSHTFYGHPRIPAEWLTQSLMYVFWVVLGDFGMTVFVAALATAGLAVLFLSLEGNTYLRAFLTILAAAAAAVFWSARPQMFSFFLSAVTVYLLFLYKRRQIDRLWWFPPMMLAWVQLHPGWVIGFIIMGGTIAGEILNNLLRSRTDHIVSWQRGRKLVLVTVLGVAAVAINPVGLDLYTLPLVTFTMGSLRAFIQEWNAPNFAMPEVWPFLLLLGSTTLAIIADWRKLDWTEVIVCGLVAYLALTVSRNVALFAVVATPVLSYHIAAYMARRGWVLKTVKRPTRTMLRLNIILLVVVGLGCLAKIVLVADPDTVQEAKLASLPVEAVDYIESARPAGPMFNSYNWGGYLIFNAQDYPVFVDGRTDLYQDFVFEFVKIWSAGEGWEAGLKDIKLVVTETKSVLAEKLRTTPGWQVAHEDAVAVVFTRDSAEN